MSNPLRQRKPLRLKAYDYNQQGAYFVTLCTQNRECLFGEVMDNVMVLNEAGRMVEAIWNDLSTHYPSITLDAFIIMPNHVHGVININTVDTDTINQNEPCEGDALVASRLYDGGTPQGRPLPVIMDRFKSTTTVEYIRRVKRHAWPPFDRKLWQRGYHDHIVRNEADLNRIREYIQNNPAQWVLDTENPIHAHHPVGDALVASRLYDGGTPQGRPLPHVEMRC
jgi:putative transposase